MSKPAHRNPYLGGKDPKATIEATLTQTSMPFLNDTERLEVIQSIAESAQNDFFRCLERLNEIISTFNPLQLLAHFAYYDQIRLGEIRSEKDYESVDQSVVEWFQALILRKPEKDLEKTLYNKPATDVLIEVNKLLNEVQSAFCLMRFGASKAEIDLSAELIRQHTAFVRNEGFPSQIKRIHSELFLGIDDDFEKIEGFSLTTLLNTLARLSDSFVDKIKADLMSRGDIIKYKESSTIIEKFAEFINAEVDEVNRGMAEFSCDVDAVRRAVFHFLDERNYRFFFFDLSDFRNFLPEESKATAEKILGLLSIPWGSLSTSSEEYLFTDNPVWSKPVIAVGNNKYFFPLPGMVASFGDEIAESLLRKHPKLWEKYCSRVRSDYLEVRTEELLRQSFSDAEVYRGIFWQDEEVGNVYENDVLIILDSHALIFECKSGRIRARARRGDTAALREELRKLVEEPAKQARRFADYLSKSKCKITLQDSGRKSFCIDTSRLLRVSVVSVTLDYFGPLSTQQRILRKAGLIESDMMAVCIPLAELETTLDILACPSMAFHYLSRRAEIENSNDMLGDGLSLLALYLATSFDFGEMEGQSAFAVSSLSRELKPYLMGKELGYSVVKPKMKMRTWWRDVLAQFEERKFLGWMEASYALLSAGYVRQEQYEKIVTQLKRKVKSNWHKNHDDTCIMVTGVDDRKTAIVCTIVKNKTRLEGRQTVNDRMSFAFSEHKVNSVLALRLIADQKVYPYAGAYFSNSYINDSPEWGQTFAEGPS